MSASLPIDQIKVIARHRRDLGDVPALATSIEDVGLLNPITVTQDGRLIAGQRRLEAFKLLGRTDVPVRVADNLTEARAQLRAERDENTCREDMKPSEKVALGLALEELERPAAVERMTLGKVSPGSETRGERTGKVYDLVGEAVGMSGPTYKRAKAVVAAAEDGDAVAVEALERMDKTGKVTPAYDRVTGRSTQNGKPTGPRPLPLEVKTQRQRQLADAARDRADGFLARLDGGLDGFQNFDARKATATASPEQIAHWRSVIKRAQRVLREVDQALEATDGRT